MALYRSGVVALPLQQSLFGGISRLGELLELGDVLPEGRFGALLEESGDLYLNSSDVALVSEMLPGRLTEPVAARIEREHRRACADLHRETDEVARVAASLDQSAVRSRLALLGSRVAAMIPYGIITKFAPDVVLGTLREHGDTDPPPYPNQSAGQELTEAMADLFYGCRELGYDPHRLAEEWPHTPWRVSSLVRDFCRRHAGFGPLPWDEPAYEDPRYVIETLLATFGDADPNVLRATVDRSAAVATAAERRHPLNPSPPTALRKLLGFWLEFMEWETWYVRRAFFVGVTPLLRRLAETSPPDASYHDPVNCLFMGIDELAEGVEDQAVIDKRRLRYVEDREYLNAHRIESGRLAAMVAMV